MTLSSNNPQSSFSLLKLLASIAAVTFALLFLGCLGLLAFAPGGGTSRVTPSATSVVSEKTAEPEAQPEVSYNNYLRIQNGQSREQVETILGPGTETASTQFGTMVQWPGDWGASIQVTFESDQVVSKTQFGLESSKP